MRTSAHICSPLLVIIVALFCELIKSDVTDKLNILQRQNCKDGPGDIKVVGVQDWMNFESDMDQVVVFENGIGSFVSEVWPQGSVELAPGLDNPFNMKSQGEHLRNTLNISGQDIVFNKSSNEFKVRISAKDKIYTFGGFTQTLLGCPQPLCADSRIDAMVGDEEEILIFRGKFYWRITPNSGTPTTIKNALVTTEKFPTVNYTIAAAVKDHLGNFYFFDYHNRVHIYLKSIINLADAAIPGLGRRINAYWEDVSKIIETKFGTKISPEGYTYITPTNGEHVLNKCNLSRPFSVDSALWVKGESQGTIVLLVNGEVILVDLINTIKNALVEELAKINAFKRRAFLLTVSTPDKTPENELSTSPIKLADFHPDLRTPPIAAFSNNSLAYLLYPGEYITVRTRNLNVLGYKAFKDEKLNVSDGVWTQLFRCEQEYYVNWGLESADDYYRKYLKKLSEWVEEEVTQTEVTTTITTDHSTYSENFPSMSFSVSVIRTIQTTLRTGTPKGHLGLTILFAILGFAIPLFIVLYFGYRFYAANPGKRRSR